MSDFWSWLGDFVMSPGFGGLAAVVAASIAFRGVTKTVRARQAADRKQQWWDRARWALDLSLDEDSTKRETGQSVLTALATSEYAAEHETDIIEAAVESALAAYAAQGGAGDTGEDDTSEANLEPDDENGGVS